MISVSTSHAVGPGFASHPFHNKYHHENGTNCLPAWHAFVRVGVGQWNPTVLKAGYGTVYGDMYLKDFLGSIARVGYYILVLDFYLVLHDLQC